MNKNNDKENVRKVYIRPEDILELILENIEYRWDTIGDIEKNIEKMLGYFKTEKFDKLHNEFGL